VNRLILCFTALTSLASIAPLTAQQKPEGPRAGSEQIPLRVQLVVARYQGDKKISSIPYTLSVVANDNAKTSMRMGVDVPVPQTVFKGGDVASAPISSFNYRSVGTNIDCFARTIEGGWFKLDLGVSDSAVYVPEKGGTSPGLAGIPSFRSFTSTFNVLLKDGQTAQHIAATDPVSGEVLRVDVTLTVLK
jgi:type II secretory pathway component GspD/PulD (secretin)